MPTTGAQHEHTPNAPLQPAGPGSCLGSATSSRWAAARAASGKSTVSVNLALALQQIGGRIGLVDADILGPSIPGMLGLPVGQPPTTTPDGKIVPADRHDLKVMSMGMLTGDDNPAILRGPMVGKYLKMFIGAVQWGQLDYLILDLPPGTGDTQLTLAQSYPLSGAIIVTTPQDVSLKIARRGLRMFETVHVPILGIIENMSTFTCPHCGKGTDVFRSGGGERMSRAARRSVPGRDTPRRRHRHRRGRRASDRPREAELGAGPGLPGDRHGTRWSTPGTSDHGAEAVRVDLGNRRGRASLGRERRPAVGLSNDRDRLPPARRSHAVRALGGRPPGRLRRPGPPAGVPMRRSASKR